MQNVHGCQKTAESEKLHYETQKDNGDESQGDRQGTARKTGESPRRKRGRKTRKLRYQKG